MSSSTTNNAAQDAPLSSNAPLADRMTQDTAGAIKPIAVTEREKKAERENDHHGAGSSLGEKISNALDFPGLNSKPPPAQQKKGL